MDGVFGCSRLWLRADARLVKGIMLLEAPMFKLAVITRLVAIKDRVALFAGVPVLAQDDWPNSKLDNSILWP